MNDPSAMEFTAPSLPKGGGAIHSIGKGMGPVGTTGAASFEVGLPISPGRGFAPALSLGYSSGVGNSLFGIGFSLSVNAITRRTSKGVPTYTDDDVMVGPSGDVWMAERDQRSGAIISRTETTYNHQPVGSHTVVRYWPRTEGAFDLIEHWSTTADKPGFWLIHGTDGSLHLFGKTQASRRADPKAAEHVGVWLLDESLNLRGEHIVYTYKAEAPSTDPTQSRDYSAQRYLSKVYYGNFKADGNLYSWQAEGWKEDQWHFVLLFDYGERTTDYALTPGYAEAGKWLERDDPFSNFAYGFELSTRRLCRQVLMFHRFPDEATMGPEPLLIQRLLFDYQQSPLGYHHLKAAHLQAYDAKGRMESRPPVEFSYNPFELNPEASGYHAFDAMPGLNDGQRYHLVDLNGEGLPGILYSSDKAWYYRAPLRANPASHLDEVAYSDWERLPNLPNADSSKPLRQSLTDLNGDGRLEWLVTRPGYSVFFTRNPDQRWSSPIPFAAMPTEFFHPSAQLADLVGDGLSDLAMIGPKSVRLYANGREQGFEKGVDVPHTPNDRLPLHGNSQTELVAFADLLGSGQQHLIRIRYNEVWCWPNLGRGVFGEGFRFSTLSGFEYSTFNAAYVQLADLDGSGAVDMLYLKPDHALIFMNRCGTGFEGKPVELPWPTGVRYDRFCQVSLADLQGLGCSSLILTVPHMSPRHWRYDFVDAKPYLLNATNNNMGAAGSVTYRSCAQEWLDEKQRLLAEHRPAISYLPFPVPVVKQQSQLDEITGNRLTQLFEYRQGYYDGIEREFHGFAVLLATDTENQANAALQEGYTAPILTRTRFHTGRDVDMPSDDDFSLDTDARPLQGHVYTRYHPEDEADEIRTPTLEEAREMARTLSGSVLSVEVYAAADYVAKPKTAVPYSVQHNRYLVRELRGLTPLQPYSVMLPLALESISYQYEHYPDAPDHFDPLCQHTLSLSWDRKGHLTHGVSIAYARRKIDKDTPPFSDTYPQTWWRDAHDNAQQYHYLTETLAEYIHLDEKGLNWQGWRLGLPYRQRGNAIALKKKTAPNPFIICWESFAKDSAYNPLDPIDPEDPDDPHHPKVERMLAGMSVQRYKDAKTGETLNDGTARFDALPDYTETAELDEVALKAYEVLPPADRPDDAKFKAIGYHEMPAFFPDDKPLKLWSVKRGFAKYGGLDRFYNVETFQATKSHGITSVDYDPYYLLSISVTLPDGCTTRVEQVDYRTGQPARIVDPNGNSREACYGAFGQLFATSFYGTEWDSSVCAVKAVGFHPIEQYLRPEDDSPTWAIEHKKDALLNAATASFEDSFSWMGRIPEPEKQDPEWLKQWVAQGDLLMPGYCIRASARIRLEHLKDLTPADTKLQALIKAAQREPAHAATLQADRYPYDPEEEKQFRCAIACWDGFSRLLQTKQEVEAGKAYVVDDNGNLKLDDKGDPLQAEAKRRWRVSERKEYNNKGQAIRIYRPYFADQYRYINDQSFRKHGYHDKQFYDAPGRPTETWLANGWMRRMTYCSWYHYLEDENDTQEEVLARNNSH
ncbi:SpvB/TcaC N-terminal domain-containing protein [Pseudomonas fluorescens]|uniref:Toxin n=1 Tax=Pseudomonas fluorescens TaxID=294 RepID=A0A5E7G2Y5_PSEFL|nr:SpvB/TcaC N-terminal domain-containing protein [Pseudomonas fluorescens]VVO43523.1 hypothetical protein PS723_06195 [Pseudomonas fluorescens]